MKTVLPHPEFLHLKENEIFAALEAYEALLDAEDDDWDETEHPEAAAEEEEEEEFEDPIVREVERLIAAYAARFDVYCREHGEIPEEALLYKPNSAIEQIAFQIFTEALHDSLMDEDDE